MRTTARNPICAHLRRLISPCDHGVKLTDGRVVHANTNECIVRGYNSHGWVRGVSNAEMMRHFAGDLTVYFTAAGRIETSEVLIMIDVDCHKAGTFEASVAFARHLRDHHFPGLYFEPSTNGNGVHAYILLNKRGLDDVRTHSLFGMMDRALKGLHAEWQARKPDLVVELVEVKGHPPRIRRDDRGKVVNYTSGQLAKLPREVDHRWDEFRMTTKVDERRVRDFHCRWKVQAATSKKKTATTKTGSITGHVVGREALDRFNAYHGLAVRLMPGPLRTSGREVATAEDLAILLMIFEACTNRMNADGSMPTARISKNWDVLYENGEVSRPFNAKRYAAMRNFLSRENMLDWEDDAYLPHQLDHGGKGRAARWRASHRLMEMIESAKGGGEVARVSGELGDEGRGQGVRERREHLYGDNFDLHLLNPQEVGPIQGNHPPGTRDLVSKGNDEELLRGDFTLRLRELRHLHYPRPVLRFPSSWRLAA